MHVDLSGQVGLITGASIGMGRSMALAIARCGADVAFCYRTRTEQAQQVRAQIEQMGRRCLAVQADVADAQQVRRLFEQYASAFGRRMDFLINNAGDLIQRTTIEQCNDELWHRVLDVNLSSTFYCCREAIPLMKAQGRGRIINVSSIAARNGGGGGSVPYAAAKGGVTTFTKGLARELAPFGILVNAIHPGLMLTRFHLENTPPERIERVRQQTPLGRVGQADDVVGTVLLLLSDAAGFICGECIEINGGLLMD